MEKMADTIETNELSLMPHEIMVTDKPSLDDLVIVEEPDATEDKDYEKTQNLNHFMAWVARKLHNLPQHSGKTTAGCERVIAHLKMLDKEISKAISRDLECQLDDQEVEQFRKEIRKMTKKLERRHKEINEAYDADDDKFAMAQNLIIKDAKDTSCTCHLDKNAQTTLHCPKGCVKVFYTQDALQTHMAAEHGEYNADDMQDKMIEANACPKCKVQLWKAAEGLFECISCDEVFKEPIKKEATTPRIQLIMDPFQRAITGIIVNSVVSQGRNAEETYKQLKQQYKFSERDELSIQQLLTDMGYPVARNFMGAADKNVEFMTNYNA